MLLLLLLVFGLMLLVSLNFVVVEFDVFGVSLSVLLRKKVISWVSILLDINYLKDHSAAVTVVQQ